MALEIHDRRTTSYRTPPEPRQSVRGGLGRVAASLSLAQYLVVDGLPAFVPPRRRRDGDCCHAPRGGDAVDRVEDVGQAGTAWHRVEQLRHLAGVDDVDVEMQPVVAPVVRWDPTAAFGKGPRVSEHAWNRVTAAALGELVRQEATVLLPLGSTEQHGPHLPTGTDGFLAAEVCVRVATLLAPQQPVVISPTVWCGLAEHHMAFGGTFSVTLGTLHALLRDLCASILRAGFRKILIVNGHGGNIPGLTAIVSDLSRELDVLVACTTYVLAAPETTRRTLEHQGTVMHACEAETSMVMAIAPDLVRHDRLADAYGPALGLTTELTGLIYTSRSFADLTASGVAGDARSATAVKGEVLLDGYARGIADALRHDQPWVAARAAPAQTQPAGAGGHSDGAVTSPEDLPPVAAAPPAQP